MTKSTEIYGGSLDPVARLEALTPLLPEPLALPVKIFKLEDGRPCAVYLVFEVEDQVNVVNFAMPEGSIFITHKHDQFECIVPYIGKIQDLVTGKTAEPKSMLYMNPGEAHRIQAITDTMCIAIAVPASPGYPHADR